jgi:hypothetical protein
MIRHIFIAPIKEGVSEEEVNEKSCYNEGVPKSSARHYSIDSRKKYRLAWND